MNVNHLHRSVLYAERLRLSATPAERELCRILDEHRISYVFQSNVCDTRTGRIFIADFRIRRDMDGIKKHERDKKYKLFIEIDGESHVGREGYDAWRTEWLETNRNAIVVRFTNTDVFERPQHIIASIESHRPARRTVRPSLTSAARPPDR